MVEVGVPSAEDSMRASAMAVKACLNGARTRAEHPAVPQSPAELAADAIAAQAAGAFAVHIHPRDLNGLQTMAPKVCDAAVAAIRAAAPRLPVGVSTSASIDPDPFARMAALTGWRQRPDFVSVNLSELGWAGIARAALHAGIAIEAGLSVAADAEELRASPFAHQTLRALVEVDGGAEDARGIAGLIPPGVAQLWHGSGARTWEVIAAAAAAGIDVRVGLEDVLVLPDGRTAADNAELVAAAVALTGATG
ncbi:MAG: 3-keto-5-aminohexanoate cleavage protein [Solirubrobacteraceae bacterium]